MRNFTSKLAPAIREYLEHRKILGYSSIHEEHLYLFDAYCLEYHPELETLTKDSVRGWVGHEISQGHGRMHSKAASVRMLAQYIGKGAYVLPETAAVKAPKNSNPYILTDDELSRLFNAADSMVVNKHSSKKGSSLKLLFPTMLRLLYTCGLRPQEVRQIKRDNIDFVTGEILIEKTKGYKGHQERVVVMFDDMLRQCQKYDTIRAVENPRSRHFFVRPDGIPVSAQHLTLTFKRCWQRANPDIPSKMLPMVRPYDLRHRFASAVLQKWLNEGQDLYAMLPYLRAYMGHKEFSSTAYYIHLLPEHLLRSAGVDWSSIDSISPEAGIWEN